MMDAITSKDGHFETDLEKGAVSDELGSCLGLTFGTIKMNQLYTTTNCSEGLENVNLMVVDRNSEEETGRDISEKKIVREKPKAMSAKKPPKPPRPPRGLSLDSADQKLIRELHELAKLKRARIERMKALKKAKEAKVVSSKNHQFATLLTVLFCLVLLFQGISSRTNSAVNFQGSPISSRETENSIISIQQSPSSSASTINKPVPESPSLVEPGLGFDTPKKVSTAVG